jgi:NADPH:quinone reductase-like Zn-dependent oxidoreductase
MGRMANPDAGDTGTMRAVVIDDFGGPEQLQVGRVPVPSPGRGQVLIRLETAGVGPWAPSSVRGATRRCKGTSPSFPHVLGSEGAGTIAAVGDGVTNLGVGAEEVRSRGMPRVTAGHPGGDRVHEERG